MVVLDVGVGQDKIDTCMERHEHFPIRKFWGIWHMRANKPSIAGYYKPLATSEPADARVFHGHISDVKSVPAANQKNNTCFLAEKFD